MWLLRGYAQANISYVDKYELIHSPKSRAVWPYLFLIFGSAPFPNNIFTTSKCPLYSSQALVKVFKIFITD